MKRTSIFYDRQMCTWMGECRKGSKRKFSTYESFEKHFKNEHCDPIKTAKDVAKQEENVAKLEAELPKQKQILSLMRFHSGTLNELEDEDRPVLNVDCEYK
jgi:NADH:ubiquinone oxidoreductase subunit F (NADH-binding)